MTATSPPADWLKRLDALWKAFDSMRGPDFLAAMEVLAAELSVTAPRALFERASANDSIGNEVEAAPLYQAALDAGLADGLLRRCTIQYASTLRNLGRATEGLALLDAERSRTSDDLDDAVTVFRALMLSDLGQDRLALAETIVALAGHLPRYQRSVTSYAKALSDGRVD